MTLAANISAAALDDVSGEAVADATVAEVEEGAETDFRRACSGGSSITAPPQSPVAAPAAPAAAPAAVPAPRQLSPAEQDARRRLLAHFSHPSVCAEGEGPRPAEIGMSGCSGCAGGGYGASSALAAGACACSAGLRELRVLAAPGVGQASASRTPQLQQQQLTPMPLQQPPPLVQPTHFMHYVPQALGEPVQQRDYSRRHSGDEPPPPLVQAPLQQVVQVSHAQPALPFHPPPLAPQLQPTQQPQPLQQQPYSQPAPALPAQSLHPQQLQQQPLQQQPVQQRVALQPHAPPLNNGPRRPYVLAPGAIVHGQAQGAQWRSPQLAMPSIPEFAGVASSAPAGAVVVVAPHAPLRPVPVAGAAPLAVVGATPQMRHGLPPRAHSFAVGTGAPPAAAVAASSSTAPGVRSSGGGYVAAPWSQVRPATRASAAPRAQSFAVAAPRVQSFVASTAGAAHGSSRVHGALATPVRVQSFFVSPGTPSRAAALIATPVPATAAAPSHVSAAAAPGPPRVVSFTGAPAAGAQPPGGGGCPQAGLTLMAQASGASFQSVSASTAYGEARALDARVDAMRRAVAEARVATA
eukprot:TRINITY_DN1159_c2_g2_i1.p1 TRINITY_DN1159_c2_g2~~TRINITY_DN1159_c2_g2_i1.p1  ORF type:complete len:594 (+),score=111.69 TRINITY_DN1159_c2_g2_i1:43-1782(+)